MELKQGTLYLIRHDSDKHRHFEGIFKEYVSVPFHKTTVLAPTFINCYGYYRNTSEKVYNYSDSNYYRSSDRNELNTTNTFCDPINTRYYDSKKVKNSQNAKQNRERRTVNMILRRFIGDPNFEW